MKRFHTSIIVVVALMGCGPNAEVESLNAQVLELQKESEQLRAQFQDSQAELTTVTEKLVRVKVERDILKQELRALGR